MKTLFQRPDYLHDPLFAVTTVYNPIRFRSRWKLWEDLNKRCEEAGVILYTVEVAYGRRDFVLTEANNPRHIQLATRHELWLKENALNIGIARLPLDWKYVAWLDADIRFVRDDWADETRHQLQHYDLVQMWSEAYDLSADHQILQQHHGFAYCYAHKMPPPKNPHYYGDKPGIHWWHPGFAFACRRKAFDVIGGLIDFCVLGSADHHMANAIVGQLDKTIVPKLSKRYKDMLRDWAERASALNKNLGYVPGALLHYWHGPKAARRYQDRWQILIDTGFNPDRDLKRDWQGLYQLTNRSIELRDQLRAYGRQRNEDAVASENAWKTTMIPGFNSR